MPRVTSSAIDRVHYEPADRLLDIWYVGGGHYRYSGVPAVLYAQLLVSSSVGAFVNQRIKPHFACTEISQRRRFRPSDDA